MQTPSKGGEAERTVGGGGGDRANKAGDGMIMLQTEENFGTSGQIVWRDKGGRAFPHPLLIQMKRFK